MPSPPRGPAGRTMVTRSPAPAARCSETDSRGARVGTQTTPSTMPSTCRAGRVIEPRSLATVTLVGDSGGAGGGRTQHGHRRSRGLHQVRLARHPAAVVQGQPPGGQHHGLFAGHPRIGDADVGRAGPVAGPRSQLGQFGRRLGRRPHTRAGGPDRRPGRPGPAGRSWSARWGGRPGTAARGPPSSGSDRSAPASATPATPRRPAR